MGTGGRAVGTGEGELMAVPYYIQILMQNLKGIVLTQEEADALIELIKTRVQSKV